jgi:hypothetical protein
MTDASPSAPAATLFRLATAYQASAALAVAVRLGLPDLLAERARTADELAAATGCHAPSLRRLLLDLPAVVARADFVLPPAEGAARCQVVGGDMFAKIPAGGDIYALKGVIHDWEDGAANRILQKCRAAMTQSGARLLLIERVMQDRADATPMAQGHALGDLNMLVRTGGRERTESEFGALLDQAGLRLLRVVPNPKPHEPDRGRAALKARRLEPAMIWPSTRPAARASRRPVHGTAPPPRAAARASPPAARRRHRTARAG